MLQKFYFNRMHSGCFAWITHPSAPHAYVVPTEATRGRKILMELELQIIVRNHIGIET